MRKTHALVQLALALAEDPHGRHYGYALRKRSGVRSGVLYPLLDRMLTAGWLADDWEDFNESEAGRPARRYYVMTDHGRGELAKVLDDARGDARFVALFRA
jgi:PadR family transcriptional regulator, regulatory protein PadR